MSTSLNKYYQTNSKLEVEGNWFESESGASFLVRRMGGKNQKKINESRAKHFMAHIEKLQNNTMPEDDQERIFIKVFVESCLIDWRGVFDENENDIEFNSEIAEQVLIECPDLFNELVDFASNRNKFKKVEELGNS